MNSKFKFLLGSLCLAASFSAAANATVGPGTQQAPAGSVIAVPGITVALAQAFAPTTGGVTGVASTTTTVNGQTVATISVPITVAAPAALTAAISPGGTLSALAVNTVNAAGQAITILNNVTVQTAQGPVVVTVEINKSNGQVTIKPANSTGGS